MRLLLSGSLCAVPLNEYEPCQHQMVYALHACLRSDIIFMLSGRNPSVWKGAMTASLKALSVFPWFVNAVVTGSKASRNGRLPAPEDLLLPGLSDAIASGLQNKVDKSSN